MLSRRSSGRLARSRVAFDPTVQLLAPAVVAILLAACAAERSPDRAREDDAGAVVAASAAALTAPPPEPLCYGAAGLEAQAPWPMIGLCPMHRGRSPIVGPQ